MNTLREAHEWCVEQFLIRSEYYQQEEAERYYYQEYLPYAEEMKDIIDPWDPN